jgi:hypothetical protein
MVGLDAKITSRHEKNDVGHALKIPRVNTRFATLKMNAKKMITYLCKYGSRVESLEEDIIHICYSFNNVIGKCQKTTNLITATLSTDVDGQLTMVEDLLNYVLT